MTRGKLWENMGKIPRVNGVKVGENCVGIYLYINIPHFSPLHLSNVFLGKGKTLNIPVL